MINVSKLNNTIDDLENQVINIKKISKVANQLEKLSDEVMINNNSYNKVIEELGKIKIEIGKIIDDYNVSKVKHQENMDTFNKELLSKVDNIGSSNTKFYEEISNVNKSFKNDLIHISKELDLKIEDTITEIEKYRESIIRSEVVFTNKVDNHATDIIHNFSKQVNDIKDKIDLSSRKTIEELTTKIEMHTNDIRGMVDLLQENTNKSLKRISILSITTLVMVASGLILSVVR